MGPIAFRDHAGDRFQERMGRPMTAADRAAISAAITGKTAIIRRHDPSGVMVLSIRLAAPEIVTVVYNSVGRSVITVLPTGGKIMDPEKMKRRFAKLRRDTARRARYAPPDGYHPDHEFA